MLAPSEEKYYRDFLAVLNQKWQPAKAAFYALDPASSTFRLKAQFGFSRTDHLAERIGRNEALFHYIHEHREPTYFNSVSHAGKLTDLMAQAASTRMLLAPLYLEGRPMGVVDVREKAGRQAYSGDDVLEISDLLRRFAIELRRIADARGGSSAMIARPAPPAPPVPSIERPVDWLTSVAAPPPALRGPSNPSAPKVGKSGVFLKPPASLSQPEPDSLPGAVARANRLVEETLARGPAPKVAAPAGGGLSPREAEFITLYLPTCLGYQEVEVAAVSSFVPGAATVMIAARRPLDPDIAPALLENLEKIFAKAAVAFPFTSEPSWRSLGAPQAGATAVHRAEIVSIQSSVLDSSAEGVVLFSLLFRHGPNPAARDSLRPAHVALRNLLASTRSEARYSEAYRGLINKLLEPGLQKRAALKTHSFNVGRMARKLAARLGVTAAEVEQVTVAGLLHDVGMRELNYDSLYAKRSLTEEEMALVRQHPRVGAFLVEDIAWPYPVAPLIRHHHERWDGGGYPDGLKGDEIPFGSRIIHLCEAFDALTSPTSYRAVLSDYQAIDILDSKAGTQFDPTLTPEFKRMVEDASG
ncbi:MAG TPA: HD domain-containing phosphohydrolase [Thermoanaerobaculia bacterium]|nr:HD domain-containing phosphohydrolase [Thermoanaerobaculia bacterium]